MPTQTKNMETFTIELENHMNRRIDGVVKEVHTMQSEFSAALARQGAAIESLGDSVRNLASIVRENTPKPFGPMVYVSMITVVLAILTFNGGYVNLNLTPVKEETVKNADSILKLEDHYYTHAISQAYNQGRTDTDILWLKGQNDGRTE